MFEAEYSNCPFKFIDGIDLEEDIMFLSAVCTYAFCRGAVCTGMAR